jgi:hypothetical protein
MAGSSAKWAGEGCATGLLHIHIRLPVQGALPLLLARSCRGADCACLSLTHFHVMCAPASCIRHSFLMNQRPLCYQHCCKQTVVVDTTMGNLVCCHIHTPLPAMPCLPLKLLCLLALLRCLLALLSQVPVREGGCSCL